MESTPTNSTPDVRNRKGTTLDNKYEIRERIGSGGMGEVWKAVHRKINREVAIKLINPDCAAKGDAVSRFIREARLGGSIKSDYICDVYDVGIAVDGSRYLVMQLLEGRTLRDLMAGQGRLTVERATRIARQILFGLEAAHTHEEQVIHRDLKPDNIFLTTVGEQKDFVKILDFGIAKVKEKKIEEQMTMPVPDTMVSLGTPAYMAPEQVKSSGDVDLRADLYAVGVILYEALTGRQPFVREDDQGISWAEICHKVLSAVYDPPRTIEPSIPHSVERVIIKAMSREPSERYSSAVEMWNALSAAAEISDDDDITNLPTVSEAPPGREPRRSSRKIVLAVGVTAFVVIGIVGVALLNSTREIEPIPAPLPRPLHVPSVEQQPISRPPSPPSPASAAATTMTNGPVANTRDVAEPEEETGKAKKKRKTERGDAQKEPDEPQREAKNEGKATSLIPVSKPAPEPTPEPVKRGYEVDRGSIKITPLKE